MHSNELLKQIGDCSRWGYYRVALFATPLAVGDPSSNAQLIIEKSLEAAAAGACISIFPELSLSGYTAKDLFLQTSLLDECKSSLMNIVDRLRETRLVVVCGIPLSLGAGQVMNCAVVSCKGKILGAVPKSYIPCYDEFEECRWFSSGENVRVDLNDPILGRFRLSTQQLFQVGQLKFGIEICEDLWAPAPPSTLHALAGAQVIINCSASPELVCKAEYRRDGLVRMQSAKTHTAYLYASSGPTESTQEVVYGGHLIAAENGKILGESARFLAQGSELYCDLDIGLLEQQRRNDTTFRQSVAIETRRNIHIAVSPYPHPILCCESPVLMELRRNYPKLPFVPAGKRARRARVREILDIQSTGLARRLLHTKLRTMVLGVSGGLDSTLALFVCREAVTKLKSWNHETPLPDILAVSMPGLGTSAKTRQQAETLAQLSGARFCEIDIKNAVKQHFQDIGHDANQLDVVYENAQARTRTLLLMQLANKHQGLVVGTGDMSENWLGWCTYNGDHMSMYAVNSSVPKTLVRYLIAGILEESEDSPRLQTALRDVLASQVSPELLPTNQQGDIVQLTEELIGPYELHDFFLYYHLRHRFEPEKIYFLAAKTFSDEYTLEQIKWTLLTFFRRGYSQQFKRTAMPPGPKIGSVALSPRGDLRLPDEASVGWMGRRLDDLDCNLVESSEQLTRKAFSALSSHRIEPD